VGTLADETDVMMSAAAQQAMAQEAASSAKMPNGAGAELTRLNATIETLYAQKRQLLTTMQARHNEERVLLENDFTRRMDELNFQASEAFKALSQRHDAEIEPLKELLRRVEMMRA
jgi:hypothetical protein